MMRRSFDCRLHERRCRGNRSLRKMPSRLGEPRLNLLFVNRGVSSIALRGSAGFRGIEEQNLLARLDCRVVVARLVRAHGRGEMTLDLLRTLRCQRPASLRWPKQLAGNFLLAFCHDR